MGPRSRYVVVGIVLLAILLAVSLSHGLTWAFAQLGWEDLPIVTREVTLTRVLAYGLSVGAAVFVLRHGPTFQLANEVVDELAKVTWPTREETGNATVVVIVTVIVCSAYLGIFDAVWLSLTNWILGVHPS
jgi:preprotein translocase SecE subunit